MDQNFEPDNGAKTARDTRADRSALMTPALLRDLIRIGDLALVGLLGCTIYLIRIHPVEPERLGQYFAALVLALLLLAVTGQMLGLYQPSVIFERRLRLGRSLAAWALVFAALLAVAFALKISDVYSRVWAFSWFLMGTSALGLFRIALSMWIERQVSNGHFANRTVIVGIDQQAKSLADHLAQGDTLQTRILGIIEDQSSRIINAGAEYDHLGDLDTLTDMIRAGEVDQVIVALPWQETGRIRTVTYELAQHPVTVYLAPGLANFDFPGRTYVSISGVPMLQLYSRPFSGWARIVKGIEDRVAATALLVLLSPLLAFIALAIKIDSPGPVLFRQTRYGFNNRPIDIYKFRSMKADADAESVTVEQATRNDPRVTTIGRFIRRTSLDELPQLVNVLRGEMSVVGPRPHAAEASIEGNPLNEVVERYAARHRVKPGITGWAQVNGLRGEFDTEKLGRRVEYDLYYIDNWSVWFDLVILARSIAIIFGDKEAY
ncbi:MAG: undecaprenyl-phosphate glucose phosphotransferase [Alphaproteobacteria bacterium]|nr:undecaprenyl-phosphate glucose phosphotransferase [Alphaproteobacteria bacterium]